ncbi:MAG: DNA gyrase subunit A [bacterium]|nr:DNA gyrase subunit A [bacterium]
MPETITPREISEEMQQSYLDYAMSVIVARALPDVRDGFKPVHRKILYAMNEMGLRANSRFRKSATVVGEVLGKYHPHGDIAVYDTMARMTQEWSMRYQLINGQGNFGSIDGDSPAAMRYTEAKLAKISEEMLRDIDKETVLFVDNYDSTRKEPSVMPAAFPNLLVNGTVGIAVGMATNIPPHNLSEVIDAIVHLSENPDANVEDLLQFVKGPDFPTGGFIFNKQDIAHAYATGKGGMVTRAKAEIEEVKEGEFKIIVTEIPYQVNKSTLLEEIANGVKEKRLDGIKDLRDESDKDGIRVVIELKRDAYPKKVLNQLFVHTQLQKSFHLNMLALVDGIQPKVLTLKAVLECFLDHRKVVIRKRSEYELRKAKDRAHILEGLTKALDHINEVIETIKKSATKEIAHANLVKKFRLSELQAAAILEMRLSTLAGLERKKIEDELAEKRRLIASLEDLLKSPKKILGIVISELLEIKKNFGDERRTKVVAGPVGEFSTEDLVPDEDTVLTVTAGGYVKRLPIDTYKVQGRGGKGVIGMTTKEEDSVEQIIVTRTHSDALFFTNSGKVFASKVHELPPSSRTAKGQALQNFLSLKSEEKVTAVLALPKDTKAKFLVMVTASGTIKKVAIEEFEHVRRSGLIAIRLEPGDHLDWVFPSNGKDEIMVVTAKGKGIRFKETDVRPMGRPAAGVRGIKMSKDDTLIGMTVIPQELKAKDAHVLVLMEHGYGKRASLTAFKVQHRGGSGIKTANVTPKTGKVVGMKLIPASEKEASVIVTSAKGQVIRVPIASVPILGRATQGVRIMRLDGDEKVATFTTFVTVERLTTE